MINAILPRINKRSRKVRPQIIRLDDELKALIHDYIAYIYETTGRKYTPGELAQKVTYEQLAEDGDRPFAVFCALRSKIVKHNPPKAPSWPLYFRGFEYDIKETILDWAKFSEANGVPMTTGEVVRGMTFMQIDDDEDFRSWKAMRKPGSALRSENNLVPQCGNLRGYGEETKRHHTTVRDR